MSERCVSVGVPVPGLGRLTYRVPAHLSMPVRGARVIVTLGSRRVTGCVIEAGVTAPESGTLKDIVEVLDADAFLPESVVALALWVAEYYAAGPGDALVNALPPKSRKGEASAFRRVPVAEWAGADATELRGEKQRVAAEVLRARPEGVPLSELRTAGVSTATVRSLERAGLVRVRDEIVERDPFEAVGGADGTRWTLDGTTPTKRDLTPEQAQAFRHLEEAVVVGLFKTILLQGVTGSGKTELYLRALAKVVAEGGKGIVLVPEISLTPQTIERFSGRFPGRVAVLHSRIPAGQLFDEWWRIRSGEFDVVVGSRGAIFAPQPRLRLIILDEEHEWTYKQQDPAPRYHAREAAVKLASLTGATVILGSATPQLESYHRAQTGEYRLLSLPQRIGGADDSGEAVAMPQVRLVDLREELRSGNRSVFSRDLRRGIETALERRQQVILFLNRRGAANFVQCRDCGYVVKCRRCSSSMTYHAGESSLRCHQCNNTTPVLLQCPDCWGPHIRFMGMGTERLELEVNKDFPKAVTLRWDRDVTQGADSHEAILRQFLDREADILIGTQMIAKGLHLPGVTLVGVV
ncbi:MAG: primosomal protein N', partial [Acidobacteria bacterium]|nr:primosomal protein N' [Acidobacteriota bacterium]